MWKVLSILFLILVLLFGYVAIKSKGITPTDAGGVAKSAKKIGGSYVSSFQDLVEGTAMLPTNLGYSAPTVSMEKLGELSPLYGKIKIAQEPWGPEASSPQEEYVILITQEENTEPINITNWSLQSMISGVRVYIPDGVEDLAMHSINPTYEIELAPGDEAVVSSGASPLGISFKTNACTGYLGQFQNFEPKLEKSCPSPRTVLPSTIENIQTYGGECLELVSELRPCEYLTDQVLEEYGASVTQACIEYLRTALTYTSCSARNKDKQEYSQNAKWRIFLGEQNALWQAQYEVIRLLDEEGRTVDVYAY